MLGQMDLQTRQRLQLYRQQLALMLARIEPFRGCKGLRRGKQTSWPDAMMTRESAQKLKNLSKDLYALQWVLGEKLRNREIKMGTVWFTFTKEAIHLDTIGEVAGAVGEITSRYKEVVDTLYQICSKSVPGYIGDNPEMRQRCIDAAQIQRMRSNYADVNEKLDSYVTTQVIRGFLAGALLVSAYAIIYTGEG